MKRLRKAVAIKSVSAWTEGPYRDEIVKMINHVKDVRLLILCKLHKMILKIHVYVSALIAVYFIKTEKRDGGKTTCDYRNWKKREIINIITFYNLWTEVKGIYL